MFIKTLTPSLEDPLRAGELKFGVCHLLIIFNNTLKTALQNIQPMQISSEKKIGKNMIYKNAILGPKSKNL